VLYGIGRDVASVTHIVVMLLPYGNVVVTMLMVVLPHASLAGAIVVVMRGGSTTLLSFSLDNSM
jgi:hypothetical protein